MAAGRGYPIGAVRRQKMACMNRGVNGKSGGKIWVLSDISDDICQPLLFLLGNVSITFGVDNSVWELWYDYFPYFPFSWLRLPKTYGFAYLFLDKVGLKLFDIRGKYTVWLYDFSDFLWVNVNMDNPGEEEIHRFFPVIRSFKRITQSKSPGPAHIYCLISPDCTCISAHT